MSRELPGPIDIAGSEILTEESAEVARIWVTNNAGSAVFIDAEVLAEPETFGFLMADTVRHAAKAYAACWKLSEDVALQAIVDGLAEELREQFNAVAEFTKGKTN